MAQAPVRRRGDREVRRRTLLVAGGAAAVAGAAWLAREAIDPIGEWFDEARDGPEGPRPRPTAVDQRELTAYRQLAGADLHYEITGQSMRLMIEPAFAGQLDACLRAHWRAVGWAVPARLSSYGSWIAAEGVADSWHHAGRAFDVGRVLAADGRELVSCRYDVWGQRSGSAREAAATAYWRLAASLHRDFAYVLTYLYDGDHHNHIHVDNGLSGDQRSTFSRGSTVQVQDVQAMCRHVWGRDVEATGSWDGATRAATQEILAEVGTCGRLTEPDGWAAFLTATAARG